jgi:hypothetical protein
VNMCGFCGEPANMRPTVPVCDACLRDYSARFSRSLLMDQAMLPAMCWAAERMIERVRREYLRRTEPRGMSAQQVAEVTEANYGLRIDPPDGRRLFMGLWEEPQEAPPPVREVSPTEMQDRDRAYVRAATRRPHVPIWHGDSRKKK